MSVNMNLHKSVLLKEAVDILDLCDGDIYLDATVGNGGHMEEVWRRMKNRVVIAGIDADHTSIEVARARLELAGAHPRLCVYNFRNIDLALPLLDIEGPNKILFDLGWNQLQVEEGERGFSFSKDEPLVMTFSKTVDQGDTTAYDVVNSWSEESLTDIIYGYGEERYSRRIAREIVRSRVEKPIETSKELADIVRKAVPILYRFGRIHPATRTFQAIRIAVNDELRALEDGLLKSFQILRKRGRIAVISFHSLEDRIVKNFFRSKVSEGTAEYPNEGGKKPIIPRENEVRENPRSRSAKLRAIIKI
jgi:16S rRNA (cytosine1402-N4)-methyltransferase